MINVRAVSLAELLLCGICPKGREQELIQRELYVLAGEGEVPACCSLQGSWSPSSWLWSATECWRKGKDFEHLIFLCMLLFAVCSFWLFIENSLRTNVCIFLEMNWDTLIHECIFQRFAKSCISIKERLKSQVYFFQCGSMDTYNHCSHMED